MEFSAAWLERYLRHKLPAPGAVEIVDIKRFLRGASRETWFVDYRLAGAAPEVRKIVLRTDLPTGSICPAPLDQEFKIYAALGHTAVPVAKALWWEDDPAWTDPGRPFYVREQVAGHWDVAQFFDADPRYDELRIAISKEHLRKLALVHAVDWRGVGLDRVLDAPADTATCVHTNVAVLLRRIDEMRGEAMPIVLEAAEWLCDHAPAAPRVCLCKGTNGYGEEIFRGREIVAMSDWEEASIGDPSADFAFVQDFIPEIVRDGETLWGLGPALDYYRSVSGIEISAASVAFYGIFRALCAISMAHAAALPFVRRGAQPYPRQAWMASEASVLYEHCLASAIGLVEPLPFGRLRQLSDTI